MKYRDYYSLNTLSAHAVNPDKKIHVVGDAKAVKAAMMSEFGELSAIDKEIISTKTDYALMDMRIIDAPGLNTTLENGPSEPEREQISVFEASDDFGESKQMELDDEFIISNPEMNMERNI